MSPALQPRRFQAASDPIPAGPGRALGTVGPGTRRSPCGQTVTGGAVDTLVSGSLEAAPKAQGRTGELLGLLGGVAPVPRPATLPSPGGRRASSRSGAGAERPAVPDLRPGRFRLCTAPPPAPSFRQARGCRQLAVLRSLLCGRCTWTSCPTRRPEKPVAGRPEPARGRLAEAVLGAGREALLLLWAHWALPRSRRQTILKCNTHSEISKPFSGKKRNCVCFPSVAKDSGDRQGSGPGVGVGVAAGPRTPSPEKESSSPGSL